MTRQRVQTLILAILMALMLVLPELSVVAESADTTAPSESVETAAPTESASDAPSATAVKKKGKQYKVKFVDPVTGNVIGAAQRVNAGDAAVAPEAPDHSDLGFQFAGWSRDFSAVKKNLTVTAQYASVHQVALGDFETAKAAPGGALQLALPVLFKNTLTGDEAASNTLAGSKKTGYDAKRGIPEYDQSALVAQGLEWIRIDLDLSGTPLKGSRDARSAYVLRSVKDSKKKFNIENGQPVNRGFAVFNSIKAKSGAKSGTYTLKGAIVWRLKGTKLDNQVPFEIQLNIGGEPEKAAQSPDGTVFPDGTISPVDTALPDTSGLLFANRSVSNVAPVIQILGPDATPAPELTPEATETAGVTLAPEETATPEATETAAATLAPEATEAITATLAPEGIETAEPTVLPEAAAAVMLDAINTPEATMTPEVTATTDATTAPDATATVEPTASAEVTAGASLFSAKGAIASKEEDTDETGDTTDAATYTATFTDFDGSTISTTTVQPGYTPSAPGDYVAGVKPIKKIGDVWSRFTGWSPELAAVTQNTTYQAQYETLSGTEEITYVDGFDGADLGNDKTTAETTAKSHADKGYEFTGWKEEATISGATISVTATSQYNLTSSIAVCPRVFATGKPKGTMTIALPISYMLGSGTAYSDTLAATGKRAENYTGKETDFAFEQILSSTYSIQDLYVKLDSFDSDDPVTAASLPTAYVVQGGVNHGYAVFQNISVKSSATNGYYELTGTLYWKVTGSTLTNSATFATQIRVTGASTSSGGSSYSGSTTTSGTEKPQAKLVVEAITTDPLNPKAGQGFDVVLSLKNTSLDYFVQNVELTYTTDEDALMPTAGSNSVYIAKIGKGESYEQRLPVKSSPELANENVKMDLAMEYEDKKLTALTASQSVMIKVSQVQRIQLDELQLPSTQPTAGDSAQVSLGIFNLGRTALYNVTAKVVSDNPNLSAGQSFFGGNMDPGTSKTAELEITPIEAGQYNASVQVTYENATGDVFTETRPFTITAAALEEINYNEDQYGYAEETPAPEAPSAAQIMQYLPLWVYAAVGLILLLIILAIAMSARRRRRRMFEDDEMD